jgi:hypothetical protein
MAISRRGIARATTAAATRAVLAAAAIAVLAGAGSTPRLYRNEAMRVRAFEPPIGWELAPQQSYTRLLASYTHTGGGRLTLSAQKVAPGTSARALVEQSQPALMRQGFADIRVQDEGGRTRLEALLEGSKRFVKQVYVVERDVAYVITLIAPQAAAPVMLRDFEDTVHSLQLGDVPAAR